MSIFTLGRVGLGFLGSAAIAGVVGGFIGCRKKEREIGANSDSTYQSPRSADLMLSQPRNQCLNPKLFEERELSIGNKTINPKRQLEVLKEYIAGISAYDAISTIRTPTDQEGEHLISLRTEINLWSGQKVFFPNDDKTKDLDNIREAIKFLEHLSTLTPQQPCLPVHYVRSESPSDQQKHCQVRRDWDSNNLGIYWMVYECQKEGGGSFRRLLTSENKSLIPGKSISTTTFIND